MPPSPRRHQDEFARAIDDARRKLSEMDGIPGPAVGWHEHVLIGHEVIDLLGGEYRKMALDHNLRIRRERERERKAGEVSRAAALAAEYAANLHRRKLELKADAERNRPVKPAVHRPGPVPVTVADVERVMRDRYPGGGPLGLRLRLLGMRARLAVTLPGRYGRAQRIARTYVGAGISIGAILGLSATALAVPAATGISLCVAALLAILGWSHLVVSRPRYDRDDGW